MNSQSTRHAPCGKERGFALIVTLSLMILLVLLAVGLLQLSAISLRATTAQQAQSAARANARLAMMLALGQLQLEMGPDARISATAGLLDTNPATAAIDGVAKPRLTGVWTAATSGVTNFTLDNTSASTRKTFRSWLMCPPWTPPCLSPPANNASPGARCTT